MEKNALTTASNTFGLNLFKLARKDLKGKNVFLSPFSISAALSMTVLGASNNTATQMAHVLGWKIEDAEKIHKLFHAFLLSLQQPSDKYQLRTVNRIYLEKTFTVKDEFKTNTQELYLAEPVLANFKENADGEAAKINSWVEEQTEKKIKDLLPPGVLNAITKMVLVNAIYFKGLWDKQFCKDSTFQNPFKLEPGKTKDVPTMLKKAVYGYYVDNENKFKAVELLYQGHDLSMVIILPNNDFDLEAVVEKLTLETFHATLNNVAAHRTEIQVFLPTFEVTSSFMLKQPLSSLGMPEAFDADKADFTGMTGQRDLVLSEVVHKAFVKVNEEGTEAAAATGAIMMMRCSLPLPVPIFKVDHPFVFAIIDKRAGGSVLFLGQVDDPSI